MHERFEHPVVRDFVLWLAMATIQDPRRPGTGFLPSSLTAGRLSFGWTTPVGGSQALPDALVRQLADHGGRVVCSAPVASIEVGVDGVRRVRTTDGRSVRVGRAVVAGNHLAQLAGMLEGAEPPADLVRARDTWRPGLSVFAVHAALRADLAFGPTASAARGRASAARPASPRRSTPTTAARRTRGNRGCSSSTRPWWTRGGRPAAGPPSRS